METNVTTLLREFPKVKKAALAGERVLIRTREGDLELKVVKKGISDSYGSLRGQIDTQNWDPNEPTLAQESWMPKLEDK